MNIEYHEFFSNNLNKDMPFKIYGQAGKPIIVFPSSGGRFYEYEDFKMIEAISKFIREGKILIYAVDSVDYESWLNEQASPADKAKRHNAYDRYIVEEFLPFIRDHSGWTGRIGSTGCSMGGFHSANFFFRHPHTFDLLIALSGIYDAGFFTAADLTARDVYLNSPIDYLKNLSDSYYLDAIREGDIIICTGQGSWEEDSVRDTRLLEEVLKAQNIPAWVDYWGYDVDHDWPWWRVQMPYFLGVLSDLGKI